MNQEPWGPSSLVHIQRLTYMPINIGTFHILPTGLHGLCFGFCFAGPLPLRSLSHGPLSRVHFGESLVIRLYSEMDHIHLSSEAQCVSHLLPPVDCHKYTSEYCLYSKVLSACHNLINGVLPHIYTVTLKANSYGNLKSPVIVKKNCKNSKMEWSNKKRKQNTFYSEIVTREFIYKKKDPIQLTSVKYPPLYLSLSGFCWIYTTLI